jgi:hypothetical protein
MTLFVHAPIYVHITEFGISMASFPFQPVQSQLYNLGHLTSANCTFVINFTHVFLLNYEMVHIYFVPFCRCYHLGNFKRFFCMIAADASDLQLCLVEPFLNEVSPEIAKHLS